MHLSRVQIDSSECIIQAQLNTCKKDVIVKSMGCANGTVRVVFATVALGMGVNLAALNRIVHNGAPRSLDD